MLIEIGNLLTLLNDFSANFDIVGILGSGSLGGGAPVTPDVVPTP